MSYWADQAADDLPPRRVHHLVTGISPSGEIHVGNLREVMTADGVFRVLQERDAGAEHIYIADNLDPLRRVYPFLDVAKYTSLVGRSLSHIPCPCGEHRAYAEHFLEPFLRGLDALGITVRIERADALYASGRMDGVIGEALAATETIAGILAQLTGRTFDPQWSPFDPRCAQCERLTGARVTGFDLKGRTVAYACDCGTSGDVPFAGGGKLTWRVDWPARWKVLQVSVEPFGKDHASRGGSYDTGVRIAREVFEIEPPHPLPYEWIALKGRGDMSSSKGNVLSIQRMLEVMPAEVLRYLVLRADPRRTISFDPGLPLLNLIDEFEDPTHRNRNARAADIATLAGTETSPVPFRHLVTVGQIAGFSAVRAESILARTGHRAGSRESLQRRLELVRRWLAGFAPEAVRFEVADSLPAAAAELDREQRRFLRELARRLPAQGIQGDQLHDLIYALVQEQGAESPKAFFAAIYLAVIGKERGPRAGHFLAALPPDFVRDRLSEAAGPLHGD